MMKDPAQSLSHVLLSRVKLRQLSLLMSLRQHGTVRRTAVALNLSQPAVTKTLREVEDIFSTRLFVRTNQGLIPTAAGEVALEYAANALSDVSSVAQRLSAIDAGLAGRVRLGFTPQVPQALLEAALSYLLDQQPRVAVTIRDGTTDELVAAMSSRELDCAIGRSYGGDSPEILSEVIYEQEPCFVVSAKSRARLSRGALDWNKFARLDWILPPTNTPSRRTLNTMLISAGVQPPLPIVETMSIRSIEAILRREVNAITIIGRDVAEELAREGHCAVLPHKLPWMLPPVTFHSTRAMASQSSTRALADALRHAARGLVKRRVQV